MSESRDINILGSTYKIIYVQSSEKMYNNYSHLVGNYGIYKHQGRKLTTLVRWDEYRLVD